MGVFILILGVVVVIVVAFVAVGHAVGSTESMPRQIVVDTHEAIEFCAQALPDRVTASLNYDDLRRLLRLHLEWIQAYHWAPASTEAAPVIFEQFDPLAYVMERCQATGLEVTAEEAAAVIQAHSDYLQIVGALHLDDPVEVEADLANAPQLESGGSAPPEINSADDMNVNEDPFGLQPPPPRDRGE